MTSSTGAPLSLDKPVGTDPANTAIKTTIAAAIQKLNDILNTSTGHTHTGAGEHGPKVAAAGVTPGAALSIFRTNAGATASEWAAILSPESNILSGDVAIAVANTWYDGPSLTLAAGTWLLAGGVYILDGAGGSQVTAILWNGTTVVASAQEGIIGAGNGASLVVVGKAVPTGSETWKISAAATTTTCTIRAAVVNNSPGNYASFLVALRVA